MVGWILLGLGLLLLGAAHHFTNILLFPEVRSHAEKYAEEVEAGHFDPVRFDQWPREEVRIAAPHGYELFGYYFPVPGSHKTVIIAHGITSNLYGSVKYLPLFRERGFNALLYDHRFHGESGGAFTSYGYYEKDDLRAWVDWAYDRCGEECIVGTHGESLGAATVLQHAAIDPRLDFVVADCPFSTLEAELRHRVRQDYGLPPFPLLSLANLLTRLRAGFSFAQVSPLDAVSRVKTPVLFIHGAEDTYVPTRMGEALYAAKPGAKRLYLVPGATHARSVAVAPEGYDRQVGEFLAELGIE